MKHPLTRSQYFYPSLDGIQGYCRLIPPRISFVGDHFYAWVERGKEMVKHLGQEHNTVTLFTPPSLGWVTLFPGTNILIMSPNFTSMLCGTYLLAIIHSNNV